MSDSGARLAAALADRYRIERELGQGGMATVYLAQDLRHDRRVAMKVLRPELAAVIGAERFLAEIKTTANLQHPHILSLFDSGEVDGTVFYVMPFVDGESLRDRLVRENQLPVEEALRIAREVADALQYAHQRGVIHRDIKPENILLQSGHALVADFGIALAAARTGGDRMTQTGMSLGTPHYMSPEQAMGQREIDARADVYALACVTYEMLAGEPPFTGPTPQAIVARVLTEPPPALRQKRATVPEGVEEAIQIALQKLPADRFRTAAEFSAALTSPLGSPQRAAPQRPRRAAIALVAGAVALTAIAAFLLGSGLRTRVEAPPLVLGRHNHVTWDRGLEILPALSPDGRSIAYASGPLAAMHVMVRPIGEGRAVPLTGDTAAAETDPRWSPDGARILYLSRGGVFSAPSGGGPGRPEVPGDPRNPIVSASWSPDGKRVAFARSDSLFIRESDASLRLLAHILEPTLCAWQPTGAFIACATGNSHYALAGQLFANLSPSRIVLCRVTDGALSVVTDSLWLNHSPTWSADGRWLYFVSNRDGPRDIYGLPISSAGQPGGTPVRLSTGLGAHSITHAGNRLAYSLYTLRSSLWSFPIPARPPVTTAGATRITNANENIENVSISPDGRWLYYDSDLPGNADIFRLPVEGGEPERVVSDPTDDFYPNPSRDGTELVFHSWRAGSRDIYVMRLDGSGIQRVTHTARQEALAQWAPDGGAISFTDFGTSVGIWVVRRDSTGRWGKPVERSATGTVPAWSPDGRWVGAVTSLAGGSLLLLPMPSGEARTVLDATQPGIPLAARPIWGPDGTLYFPSIDARGLGSIWSVPTGGGTPQLLVRFDPALHAFHRGALAVGNGRFYFPADDRQSDIWVMEADIP